MKWNIDAIPVFLAVADQQSITQAAAKLDRPKSSVSRIVTRLEEQLGLILFERNTRQVRLTDEGQNFLGHARLIMEQVDLADNALAGLAGQPSGSLTVTLPMAFGREIIQGQLAEFQQLYPDIELNILVTSHQVNLMADNIDLALAVGELQDSDLISQKIFDAPLAFVASPALPDLADIAANPASIRKAMRFCERRYRDKRFRIKIDGQRSYLDTSGLASVNDPVMLRETLIQGGGIGFLPLIYCQRQIASGQLVQILQSVEPEARATISALYQRRAVQPIKIRAFVEFARACVRRSESQLASGRAS